MTWSSDLVTNMDHPLLDASSTNVINFLSIWLSLRGEMYNYSEYTFLLQRQRHLGFHFKIAGAAARDCYWNGGTQPQQQMSRSIAKVLSLWVSNIISFLRGRVCCFSVTVINCHKSTNIRLQSDEQFSGLQWYFQDQKNHVLNQG